ncbi:MAG: glycosyltransferase, partial [Candidatus Altiarchaeales archaeon]|nr:glycosyltransferase [Candidatus Altiarchaeales archaeon]
QVEFLGHISDRQELAKWYRKARVFCVPSLPLLNDKDPFGQWSEQMGQVYLEAMASGLPIITYSGPQTTDLFGEDWLVAPRHWGDLRERLTYFLEDDTAWEIESNMMRHRAVEYFSYETIGQQIVEWYEL